MKAYQLIYVTSYTEYDEGFSYDREDMMPGKVYLLREKAEAEIERIMSLPQWEKDKYTTRFSGYLSEIRIKEWDIVE